VMRTAANSLVPTDDRHGTKMTRREN